MISLKNINSNIYNFLKILILLLIQSQIINAEENKILFKINEKAYTSYDYENRIKYLDFVGSNNNISKEIVLNDFISVSLFFEYYKNNNLNKNYENEISKIFTEVKQINIQNNKIYKYKIDKDNIFYNIKIDLIRKDILESLLKERINEIKISNLDINILYNFKLKYINFETINPKVIIQNIKNINNFNIDQVLLFLKEQKIEFFIKNKEVHDINKLDIRIKENILADNNFILIQNNKKISLIFIEKEYQTYEGIITNLFSVRSNTKLSKEYLRCNNLVQMKNNERIINKEYKLIDLNNELKTNLVSVNDYVTYNNNNDEITYIVLCDLRFDKEILNNFKRNKLINLHVKNIEDNFVKNYSKIFNLIYINE